jgi:predicted TIM-barrel fold metal-dependent hydrolase
MIIDCHNHVPSEAAAPADRRLAILETQMRHGIDHSLLFTMDGMFGDADRHNRILAEYVAQAPERVTGFATVDPRHPQAVEHLEAAVRVHGLRGLKVHPWLQGIHPLDPSMAPIGHAAARLGIPMLFHDGTPPYATPLQVAAFAERHPDVRVVLGHAGLLELWPEALAAAQRLENVWLCLCGPPTHGLRSIVRDGPTDRIVVGSDFGFGGGSAYDVTQANDDQVRHRIDQVRTLPMAAATREAILGGNARRLLGMSETFVIDGPAGP